MIQVFFNNRYFDDFYSKLMQFMEDSRNFSFSCPYLVQF